MNLLAVMVLLGACGALATSLLLELVHRPTLARLRRTAPAERLRWLLALIAAPAVSGVVAVLLAFGPCLHHLLLGLADGCRDHGGPEFFLCLRIPMHDLPSAWLMLSVIVAIAARRLTLGVLAGLRAGRMLRTLRQLGRYDHARDLWLVPGDLAVVSGWPASHIYVGERLERRASSDTLRVVVAHERAHVRHHDVSLNLLARALGLCLTPHLREHLHSELSLAMEQACDAAAAVELRDPLVVAQCLLELSKLSQLEPGLGIACAPAAGHLEARIRALCEPTWASSRGVGVVVGVLVLTLAAVCLAFDFPLHELVEAAFGRLLS